MWISVTSNPIVKRMRFENIRRLSSQTEWIPSDKITLKSTFNRQTKIIPNVSYLQKSDRPDSTLNLYCCGPTVYDHSHLGHAITYIRCDQIIKILKTFCNINVYFAMNITDIDDKIIKKSIETGQDYRDLSNEYHQSFVEDMSSLRIGRPDFVGKVTDNIDLIADYVKKIYDKGYAYISTETGDINFDYEKFLDGYSIKNAMNFGSNQLTEKSIGKRSPKDFALWKKSKPNEPKWELKLNKQLSVVGRPGWHVECSALSHKIFSDKIDIHFGGSDLLFPHHHCESCCTHVHQYDPPSRKELYSSANIWLHSGHLILRSEKMSKSLGNTVLIKDFLRKHSANILRLLCIKTHYRQEIDFDEKLLTEMTGYDEKLNEFLQIIEWTIYKLSTTTTTTHANNTVADVALLLDVGDMIGEHHPKSSNTASTIKSLNVLINDLEDNIWQGILGDFDLNRPLENIIKLAKTFKDCLPYWLDSDHQTLLYQCIRLRTLLHRWLNAVSLDYVGLANTSAEATVTNYHITSPMEIVDHLAKFRSNIRQSALDTMAMLKKINDSQNIDRVGDEEQPGKKSRIKEREKKDEKYSIQEEMIKILDYCDQTRTFLERRGIKLKDQRRGRPRK